MVRRQRPGEAPALCHVSASAHKNAPLKRALHASRLIGALLCPQALHGGGGTPAMGLRRGRRRAPCLAALLALALAAATPRTAAGSGSTTLSVPVTMKDVVVTGARVATLCFGPCVVLSTHRPLRCLLPRALHYTLLLHLRVLLATLRCGAPPRRRRVHGLQHCPAEGGCPHRAL